MGSDAMWLTGALDGGIRRLSDGLDAQRRALSRARLERRAREISAANEAQSAARQHRVMSEGALTTCHRRGGFGEWKESHCALQMQQNGCK